MKMFTIFVTIGTIVIVIVETFLDIFTGHNEVVAKVIFLHLSVILFTGGGVCLIACWDTTTPPWEQTPPPGADPPGADTPLWSRHPQEADTPRADPPGKQTPAYGQ